MVWTDERKELSLKACHAWQGTPHRNRIAVRREGVDCVRFVMDVLVCSGIIERPTLPRYDERLGLLRKHNILEDILTRHLHAAAIEPAEVPQWGDLVVTTVGKQSNHLGIIIAGEMWHCPGRGYVGPEQWADWRPRVQSLVRVHETGYLLTPSLTWDIIREIKQP